jgi:zinc transporter, ZIP family
MDLLTTAFLYSLAPVGAAAIGAVAVFLSTPSASVRSAIQHFAAGVVFSVAAVELLPEIRTHHSPSEVVIGFSLGIVLMLVLRSLTSKLEHKASSDGQELPLPMLVAIAIDVLIDGFLIGVGLRAGKREGLLLTIALSTEFLSLGLAITLKLLRQRISRPKTFGLTMTVCMFAVAGAVGSTTFLARLSPDAVQMFLSAGLAALLFLVTEELLVEAHETKETPWITASFFLGFVLFLALEMTAAS